MREGEGYLLLGIGNIASTISIIVEPRKIRAGKINPTKDRRGCFEGIEISPELTSAEQKQVQS
jgi:hypothetical protein